MVRSTFLSSVIIQALNGDPFTLHSDLCKDQHPVLPAETKSI
jgi:hypothetical protein